MLEKFNKNWIKILKVFFNEPKGGFHIRELSRMTGLSAPTVSTIVRGLAGESILVLKREKQVESAYAAPGDSFRRLKQFVNLMSIHECGLVEKITLAYNYPAAVVLFGSYSRGEDTKRSDIDIGIVTKRRADFSTARFEKKLGRKISIHELELEKAAPEFLNDLANGIVLEGYLKIR